MSTSLLRHERVRTTKAKAREIRRTVEKLITRAKVDSVHNRRTVAKTIQDKEVLAKLFTEIGPRYLDRPGGYTRILKLGFRKGDAAEMVYLELVGDLDGGSGTKSAAPPRRRKRTQAAEAPAKETQAEETPTEEAAVAEAEAPEAEAPDAEKAAEAENEDATAEGAEAAADIPEEPGKESGEESAETDEKDKSGTT